MSWSLSLAICCLISTCLADDLNCRFKPGCNVNRCDPVPLNQLGVEEYLQRKEFPITCKDKGSNDVLRLYAANADNQQEIKELKQELSQLKETNEEQENDLVKVRNEVAANRKELSQLRKTNAEHIQDLEQELLKLEEINKEQANDFKNKLAANMKEISELKEAIKHLATSPEDVKNEENKDNCDVTYNSKCFKTIVYATRNVSFKDAGNYCDEINGKPANIYDVTHYRMVQKNLREKIPNGRTYAGVWTGMKYQNNQLKLRSGENSFLPAEVWFPGDPLQDKADWENIAVTVDMNPNETDQGIWNAPPSWNRMGVICEN